ncbi:hypothetical protein GGC65_004303 [Sphingopyxis sp. OAS728]|uniref:hypothetical protein n=1 Tax=Sphingopyxis sp. OAS728 TaxID=2663823 RepID=UPI00178B2FA7|nr:hypothetical protein [Sphingopyxis sp. OAS728]MBE1529847.1 hypothetical protein [Sphingopyxis sp. OAS728]
MRTALFAAFLLIALAYALWRGGGPERAMAAIAVTIVAWDRLLVTSGTFVYSSLDIGYLALDLFGSLATITLAMTAYRFWPMMAAVLHTLPLLAHFSRVVDMSMHPAVYLTMQVASSWCLPPLLIAGTWHHRQRLMRHGSDRSWRGSSPPSHPMTASG